MLDVKKSSITVFAETFALTCGSSVYHPGNERSAPAASPFEPFLAHPGRGGMDWKIVANNTSGCIKAHEKQ
jgi:hypothetical protein